jgi:hypothetical protein
MFTPDLSRSFAHCIFFSSSNLAFNSTTAVTDFPLFDAVFNASIIGDSELVL